MLLLSASIVFAVKVANVKDKQKGLGVWHIYTLNGTKIHNNWCDAYTCRLLHAGYVSKLYLLCWISRGVLKNDNFNKFWTSSRFTLYY